MGILNIWAEISRQAMRELDLLRTIGLNNEEIEEMIVNRTILLTGKDLIEIERFLSQNEDKRMP